MGRLLLKISKMKRSIYQVPKRSSIARYGNHNKVVGLFSDCITPTIITPSCYGRISMPSTFLLRGSILTHKCRLSFPSSASMRGGLISLGERFFFAFTSTAVGSPMIESTSNELYPSIGAMYSAVYSKEYTFMPQIESSPCISLRIKV